LVNGVARKISDDYKNREVILVCVLKGAFLFLADLARQISIPVKIDFIAVSSYGSGTTTSGKISLTKELSINIKGKNVIIVEDIVDTGLTLSHLVDYLHGFGPESVKVCTMIDKHERRETDISVDYFCHSTSDGFLVGYGLDYDERYRDLPEIYHLKF
jgi:hypoxanthine phosphoribosyltransferase